jgi:hypothetical protein
MGLSLQHLLWYADEGEDMLNRTVTGDDSSVHHYESKSKRGSMQWEHPSSPSTKKFKVTNMPSAGKVMLTVFWDSQGLLELQRELLEHPFYSSDSAPSDFHLFGSIKNHHGGRCFADNKEVETEMQKWLRQQSKDFYAVGFNTPVKRWDKYINVGGGYIKKFFFRFEYHVLYVIFICGLLTDSPSYVTSKSCVYSNPGV